jgi:hypothetical protein
MALVLFSSCGGMGGNGSLKGGLALTTLSTNGSRPNCVKASVLIVSPSRSRYVPTNTSLSFSSLNDRWTMTMPPSRSILKSTSLTVVSVLEGVHDSMRLTVAPEPPPPLNAGSSHGRSMPLLTLSASSCFTTVSGRCCATPLKHKSRSGGTILSQRHIVRCFIFPPYSIWTSDPVLKLKSHSCGLRIAAERRPSAAARDQHPS